MTTEEGESGLLRIVRRGITRPLFHLRPVRFTDEPKKWLRRLVYVAGILVVSLVLLALVASIVVRQVAMHRATRDFPPTGRLV